MEPTLATMPVTRHQTKQASSTLDHAGNAETPLPKQKSRQNAGAGQKSKRGDKERRKPTEEALQQIAALEEEMIEEDALRSENRLKRMVTFLQLPPKLQKKDEFLYNTDEEVIESAKEDEECVSTANLTDTWHTDNILSKTSKTPTNRKKPE
jgi:hypothetical protein